MNRTILITLLLAAILLTSCSSATTGPTATNRPPQVGVTPAPSVESSMQVFMDAWMVEDFPSMYDMLAQVTRDAISLDDFTKRIKDALNAMNVASMDYAIISALTNPNSAQVAYRITYHGSLLGDIQREPLAQLTLENGGWKILWDDGLILPELQGGNKLQVDYRTPARGDIYDRSGNAIVTQADAVSLGFIPAQVNPDTSGTLFFLLEQLTGVKAGNMRAWYEEDIESQDYIPVGETTAVEFNQQSSVLAQYAGLWWFDYSARYYYDGGIAPHVVGYTQFISPENLDE